MALGVDYREQAFRFFGLHKIIFAVFIFYTIYKKVSLIDIDNF